MLLRVPHPFHIGPLRLNNLGISIHPMLLFIDISSSYPVVLCLFQYIPCYCLSIGVTTSQQMLESFQYIPCYCLSRSKHKPHMLRNSISIHPMLLFILPLSVLIEYPLLISIHPMLLFILSPPCLF